MLFCCHLKANPMAARVALQTGVNMGAQPIELIYLTYQSLIGRQKIVSLNLGVHRSFVSFVQIFISI